MKIINIGILAHVDAGKTTLTESLLYTSGAIAEQGNVDKGTTRTDTMILEQQRGITIQTAVTSFCWNDYKINIVDTPGVSGWPPVSSAPVSCGKGNRPACVPAAASLYRGYLSCVPSILLSIAVLPEKVSCLVVASCVSLVSPQAAKLTRSAAPPLPTKPCGFAGAPTIAAYSGVGTLPAASGRFVPK